LTDYKEGDLVKMSILVNEERSTRCRCWVHRTAAEKRRPPDVEKLKELIPHHLFKIPVQAASAARSSPAKPSRRCARTSPAKCYGGDVSASGKLLDKQKEARRRMPSSAGGHSAGGVYSGLEDG